MCETSQGMSGVSDVAAARDDLTDGGSRQLYRGSFNGAERYVEVVAVDYVVVSGTPASAS